MSSLYPWLLISTSSLLPANLLTSLPSTLPLTLTYSPARPANPPTQGTCTTSKISPPLAGVPNGGGDGLAQMSHYATTYKMNIFRLPVAWQYLTPSGPGSEFNAANLALYEKLVKGCLSTGAVCILDVHNYARWNGECSYFFEWLSPV